MRKKDIKISKKKLENISDSFIISDHSILRLKERLPKVLSIKKDGNINYYVTKRNIKKYLQNNVLMYQNTDGSINVAINKYEYFVFEKRLNKFHNLQWTLITFKEKSLNNISIFDKYKYAIKGYSR